MNFNFSLQRLVEATELAVHFYAADPACPFVSRDWDAAEHSAVSGRRAREHITSLVKDPIPNVFVVPSNEHVMCCRALVIGATDTPYEGGFFQFYVRCGPRYPVYPPRVCAMTCYRFGEEVRFGPNMYPNGKICLSILGTHEGPSWTPNLNLHSVLHAIQALMRCQAITGEPCFEKLKDTGHKLVWVYDLFIRHETLRVAVIHTLKCAGQFGVPEQMVVCMKKKFLEYFDFYIASCDANMIYDGVVYCANVLTGIMFYGIPPFLMESFVPNFAKLKRLLIKLRDELTSSECESEEEEE